MLDEIPIGVHFIEFFIPAKWRMKRAVAVGVKPRLNGDAMVIRRCRRLVGRGRFGLRCFGMGIPLKVGVIGGLSLLVGAEYLWVRL